MSQINQQFKRIPLKDSSKNFVNVTTPQHGSNTSTKKSLLDQRADSLSKRNTNTLQQQQQNLGVVQEETKEDTAKTELRMTGEELKEWQASWRRIMKASVVYFENDENKNEKEKLRARLALQSLGATFERFFSESVTIIISRRTFNKAAEYPEGDIFRVAKKNELKVWTYDKVFRFMNHLGETIPEDETSMKSKLSSLLKNEKLFGPNDRDPNAKRDDVKYFTGLYYYVYDLRQQTKPTALREWALKSTDYPKLCKSTNGRSLFTEEATISSDPEKRRKRRLQYLEDTKDYREKLIQASCIFKEDEKTYEERIQYKKSWQPREVALLAMHYHRQIKRQKLDVNAGSTEILSNGTVYMGDETSVEQSQPVKSNSMAPPTRLSREDSTAGTSHTKFNNEYGELQASGVVPTQSGSALGTASQGATVQLGNGLAPSHSLVFNKKLANDKKKMITFAPLDLKYSNSVTSKRDATPMKVFKVRKEDRLVNVVDVRRDTNFVSSEDAKKLLSSHSPTEENADPLQIGAASNKENGATTPILQRKLPVGVPPVTPVSQKRRLALAEKERQANELTSEKESKDSIRYSQPPIVKRTYTQLASLQNDKNAAKLKSISKQPLDELSHQQKHQQTPQPPKPSKREKDIERSVTPAPVAPTVVATSAITTTEKQSKKSKKEMRPGYCENCRVKYEDFDEHILMDKHRHFATNDKNFREIDSLIEAVNSTRILGL